LRVKSKGDAIRREVDGRRVVMEMKKKESKALKMSGTFGFSFHLFLPCFAFNMDIDHNIRFTQCVRTHVTCLSVEKQAR
jgi:hypothetical protein